jgi:hypothetical protein
MRRLVLPPDDDERFDEFYDGISEARGALGMPECSDGASSADDGASSADDGDDPPMMGDACSRARERPTHSRCA